MKSLGFLEMSFTQLAQSSLAFLFMMHPMDGLAGNTAVRSDFARTTFAGARFRTPRCRTRCHIGHDFYFTAAKRGRMEVAGGDGGGGSQGGRNGGGWRKKGNIHELTKSRF